MIDPTKNNFTQPLGIQEILDELKLSKDDYDKALSVSKDDNLELHLKTQPNSCFVNNCFNVGLKSWQTNMDIQPVFSEYKAVAYMCQYFSKTEDQFSQAMKQAARKSFRTICIITTSWKQLLRLTWTVESVLFWRQLTTFCQN